MFTCSTPPYTGSPGHDLTPRRLTMPVSPGNSPQVRFGSGSSTISIFASLIWPQRQHSGHAANRSCGSSENWEKEGLLRNNIEQNESTQNRWTQAALAQTGATETKVRYREVARRQLLRLRAEQDGLSTAEYAVGTVAVAGLGGLLIKLLTSDWFFSLLQGIFGRALGSVFG